MKENMKIGGKVMYKQRFRSPKSFSSLLLVAIAVVAVS